MITRTQISEKLLDYLNEQMTLEALVDWAESCFVTGGFGPDEDIPVIRNVLSYLAAADSTAFPLTWDVCLDFMRQLGTPIKAVIAS